MKEKRSSKTIDIIINYALKVSENGVTYVFVVLFRSKNTFKVGELSIILSCIKPWFLHMFIHDNL